MGGWGARRLVPAPHKCPHLMSFLGWPVARGQLGRRCLKADQEPRPAHHGARVSLHHSLGKEGDSVRVKYSSSPLGWGRVGLDTLYSENYTTLCNGATDPWTGVTRPPGPGVGRTGGKACLGEGAGGGLGVGMPGPLHSLRRLTSCAVLSFFFFLWRSELRQGNKGRGCSQVWGQSWESLPALGLAQSPMASF